MSELVPVLISQEHINDEVVTLVAWLVENGARVERDQAIAEIEGSKGAFAISAPAAGFIHYTRRAGEEVEVGHVLCFVADRPDASLPEQASDSAGPPDKTPLPRSTRLSDTARRLVEQRGLSPGLFQGMGLVRERDVLEYLGEQPRPFVAPEIRAVSSTGQPATVPGVPVRTEPLPRSKRTEARYLASSQYHVLPSVVTVGVPTRGLNAVACQVPQLKGSASPVFIFEVARLLRKYPIFNASYSDGHVNYYEQVNIGFVVDVGRGLKVPVIRDADTKGIPEIAAELNDHLVSYLNDELSVESLSGGTFTITDLSGVGVTSFVPLINHGQSGILGVGSEFYPARSQTGMFYLTLAFDHQLSSGREAAQLLNALREHLEGYEKAFQHQAQATDTSRGEPSCSRCLTPAGELADIGHCLLQSVAADGSTAHYCSRCLQGY